MFLLCTHNSYFNTQMMSSGKEIISGEQISGEQINYQLERMLLPNQVLWKGRDVTEVSNFFKRRQPILVSEEWGLQTNFSTTQQLWAWKALPLNKPGQREQLFQSLFSIVSKEQLEEKSQSETPQDQLRADTDQTA